MGSINPLLNTISQSISTTQSAVATGQEISRNTGGVTSVATILSEAGQVSSLTNAAGQLINNGSLTVPTPANSFGDSGLPPLSVGV